MEEAFHLLVQPCQMPVTAVAGPGQSEEYGISLGSLLWVAGTQDLSQSPLPARQLDRKQTCDWNPGTLPWEMGVPGSILAVVPSTFPHLYHILHLCQ